MNEFKVGTLAVIALAICVVDCFLWMWGGRSGKWKRRLLGAGIHPEALGKTIKEFWQGASIERREDNWYPTINQNFINIPFDTPQEARSFLTNFYNQAVAKPEVKAIPKELEPLAQEARKYKSAEEFVREVTRKQKELVADLSRRSDEAFAKAKEITGGRGLRENAWNIKLGEELKARAIREERKLLNQLNADKLTDFYNFAPTGQKPKQYVEVKLSDEDKTILEQIKKDIAGAQPGHKYVTRDEITGDVVKTGYEPSDYAYIPYWPEGWAGKPVNTIIDNAINKGQLTIKQKEKLDTLLSIYKEVADEQSKLEQELAGEGVSQSEIDETKRAGEEEAHRAFEVIRNEVKDMSTQDLEKFIDSQYESGASQETLDLLETLYEARISEGESSIEEAEGAGLEEQLINMYHRYINPELRQGMEVKDILSNMRSALETYGFSAGGLKENVTDDEILAAAKELYLDKQDLIKKQKTESNLTPSGQIREELHAPLVKDLFQEEGELFRKAKGTGKAFLDSPNAQARRWVIEAIGE